MDTKFELFTRDFWGPDPDCAFSKYVALPFAPFNRLEKISKCCDLALKSHQSNLNRGNDQEKEFIQVQTKSKSQKKSFAYRPITKNQIVAPAPTKSTVSSNNRSIRAYGPQNSQAFFNAKARVVQRYSKFKDSINIKADWDFITEPRLEEFKKTVIQKNPQFKIIKQTGFLKTFDNNVMKTQGKGEKWLNDSPSNSQPDIIPSSVLSDNFYFEEIKRDEEKNPDNITIYSSDVLLTALMCSKSSIFPWDMTIIKQGNMIIFDSETDRQPLSFIDLNCINENAQSLLPDEEHEIYDLCVEATKITLDLQNQAFIGEAKPVSDESIQIDDYEERVFCHRYCQWKVDNIIVNVRVRIDGQVVNSDGDQKLCLLRTLNEYDFDTEWRKSISNSQGAFRAQEFINNSNNFTRWLSTMELGKIDTLKLGYVTRQTATNKNKHSILYVDNFSYDEIKDNTKFSMQDCWSVVQYFAQTFSKYPDGKYVLIKQAYKSTIRVFNLPAEQV